METIWNHNARYSVDVDYDRIPGREDYGRDSRLTNVRVTTVYIPRLADTLCKLRDISTEDLYFVDRILRHFKVYEPEAWHVRVGQGYYGEEIDTVTLYFNLDLDQALDDFKKLTDLTKKVEFVLNLEYGYLLDGLKGCTYRLESVLLDTLGANDHYHAKLRDVDIYQEYDFENLAAGVVLVRNGYLQLVDGYHRRAAARAKGLDEVWFYVAH